MLRTELAQEAWKAWVKDKPFQSEDTAKEELKNKISMALKDQVLQIGFEIICKNLSDLEKENAALKEDLKSKDLALEDFTKWSDNKLNEAKELIEDMYYQIPASQFEYYKDVMDRAKQLLKEEAEND